MSKRTPAGPPLSRRERQIIEVLYQQGQATVSEVMEHMPDPPSYSAVRATLRVLEEKGHVTHKREGHRYVYSPTVPHDSARRRALAQLVKTFFAGSPEHAAAALLGMADISLTDTQIERLERLIKE